MIVVLGATGNIGPHLIRGFVGRGARVRVVARDTDKARARLPPGIEIVHGDAAHPAALSGALRGATRVVCAVGGATGPVDLASIECGLIDAVKAAGVRHYVKISGVDARPDAPSEIQRIHGAIEAHLVASQMPYTILRPSFFFQNLLGLATAIIQGVLPLPTGSGRAALVDARDVADCIVEVALDPAHLGKTYTLTGPAALDHHAVAAILTEALPGKVEFVDVPPAAFIEAASAAGMPAWFAARLADVFSQVFAPGLAARVTGDVATLLQRPPRSCADFVRDHRGAFS